MAKAKKKSGSASTATRATASAGGGIMLKKIAPRTVIGKIGKPEKATPLYTVGGIATGFVKGDSTYGPWTAFVGRFEGIRADDGAHFYGSKLFLHEPVQGMLLGALNRVSPDGEAPTVKFAVSVSVIPADTKVGYEYVVESLTEPVPDEALAEVRQLMLAHKA